MGEVFLFYEYLRGDKGAGVGASHQTGWSGVIARMMHLFATTTSEQDLGKVAGFAKAKRPQVGGFAAARSFEG
jgi:hypothetical protein